MQKPNLNLNTFSNELDLTVVTDGNYTYATISIKVGRELLDIGQGEAFRHPDDEVNKDYAADLATLRAFETAAKRLREEIGEAENLGEYS